MLDLLPCPFCGSPSYLSVSTHWETEGMMRVACTADATVCPVAPYVTASSRSGVIAAWNRRTQAGGGEVVAADRVFLVYDWAWTDETGQEHYARTPERAKRLSEQGIKLTPVYTMESKSDLGATPTGTSLEEVNADAVIDALVEARNQIEYLHGKFQETGSGNAVMAKLDVVRRAIQRRAAP